MAITASFKPLADRGRLGAAGAAVGDGRGDQEWDRLKELIAAWDNHKVDTAEAAADASHFGVTLILALLGAALTIAVAIAILLARMTTRAVREIAVAAKAIAQGDIDQRVDVRSRDELGEIAQRSGRSCDATPRSANGSSAPHRASPTRRSSCARATSATSATTDEATPLGWQATTSRSERASSPSATPSTR